MASSVVHPAKDRRPERHSHVLGFPRIIPGTVAVCATRRPPPPQDPAARPGIVPDRFITKDFRGESVCGTHFWEVETVKSRLVCVPHTPSPPKSAVMKRSGTTRSAAPEFCGAAAVVFEVPRAWYETAWFQAPLLGLGLTGQDGSLPGKESNSETRTRPRGHDLSCCETRATA